MNHSKNEITIPARYIDELMEVSNDISLQKEEELIFLKSCLFYLSKGENSDNAINMAMVDYLIES